MRRARGGAGPVLAAGLTAGLLVAGAACGGSDDEPATDSLSTVEVPVGADTTSATQPVDYRSAMESRLTQEWGDPGVVAAVLESIGPDGLAAWEARVPLADVATTELLDYAPPGAPAEELDAVVVFAFGNRVAADGTVTPGPMNEDLADVTAELVARHPVPVFAQWEVARYLEADGVPGVTSIEPTVDADGKVVYLSTRGVADVVAGSGEAARGRIGVICFADHQGRCLLTARAAGLDATAIEGVELPATYDPESGQPWTRDRVAYLSGDVMARLIT
jgi:hypothetical protein